jgi:hypothetical protein
MSIRSLLLPIAIFGTLLVGVITPPARAQAQVDLASLLQQTGLNYSPMAGVADAWVLNFNGDGGKTLKEYVTYNDEGKQYALIFITVVDGPEHHVFSPALLTEAMELNNALPGAKFVYDEDHGDIDCQTEVPLATATAATLRQALNRVATVASDHMEKLNGL